LDTVPDPKMNLNSGFIFGCDICQDVCPWNQRLVRKHPIVDYSLSAKQNEIVEFFLVDHPNELVDKINSFSNNDFRKKFLNTSFSRSGKRGILKNILFYLKNLTSDIAN
jgi:epoxyqueuosine reductase